MEQQHQLLLAQVRQLEVVMLMLIWLCSMKSDPWQCYTPIIFLVLYNRNGLKYCRHEHTAPSDY